MFVEFGDSDRDSSSLSSGTKLQRSSTSCKTSNVDVDNKCIKGEVLNKTWENNIESQEPQAYIKNIIPKSDAVKKIIATAIKDNVIFSVWNEKEILEFVDIFFEVHVKKGETIFNEGTKGDQLYVIETGSVNVYKQSVLDLSISGCGMSFGDIALLYDTPRNVTVRAKENCKLWAIYSNDYRGMSRLNKEKIANTKINFLNKVKIGNHILGDVLEAPEIYNIALATRTVSFTSGNIITKEGDKGDTFYIIKRGSVDVYNKACGDDPIITMVPGQFFGEKALVYEKGVRTATCIANSDVVECFFLSRLDFSKMLGDKTWLFSGINYREKQYSNKKLEDETNHKENNNSDGYNVTTSFFSRLTTFLQKKEPDSQSLPGLSWGEKDSDEVSVSKTDPVAYKNREKIMTKNNGSIIESISSLPYFPLSKQAFKREIPLKMTRLHSPQPIKETHNQNLSSSKSKPNISSQKTVSTSTSANNSVHDDATSILPFTIECVIKKEEERNSQVSTCSKFSKRKSRVSICSALTSDISSNNKCLKGEVLNKTWENNIESQEPQAYIKNIIPKSDAVKKIIATAIKDNVIFSVWNEKEILEFVDIFFEVHVKKGETIFNEGTKGDQLYVIETGSVNVYKQSVLDLSISGCGMSFGDIALLYDTPRNVTVRAKENCKLWAIYSNDYRGMSRLNKEKIANTKINFLNKVKIGNHILGDVLEAPEIYNIALATRTVSFTSGNIITKEGDKGDTFYIIKRGSVDVYNKACGDDPIITMVPGQFFGEKALVYEKGVRTATCIANSDVVECFFLSRLDFSKMLGDMTWLFSGLNRKLEHEIKNNKMNEKKKENETERSVSQFNINL